MGDDYTYVLKAQNPPFGDPIYATRHEAVGEKAIIEAVTGRDGLEVRARPRYATDPV